VSRSPISDNFSDNRKIANVIIAKNLDEAPKQVQIQALELMRTKRIFTHTSVQSAPKRFLFIALLAGGEGPRLTKHLNDHIFISHFHDPEDEFPNLEDLENDGDSISSVVRKKAINDQIRAASAPIFSASVRVLYGYYGTCMLTPNRISPLSTVKAPRSQWMQKSTVTSIISFLFYAFIVLSRAAYLLSLQSNLINL